MRTLKLTTGNIGEPGGNNGGNTTSHHAVQSEGDQRAVAAPSGPVQRVVVRIIRLWFEDDLAVRRELFVLLLLLPDRRRWRLRQYARGQGRMGRPSRSVPEAQGLVSFL